MLEYSPDIDQVAQGLDLQTWIFSDGSQASKTDGTLAQRLETSPCVFRLGAPEKPAQIKALVGHCVFGSDDRALLVSLLPEVIHVHGEERLMALVQMINEETRADRAAREMVLHRLLEVLFIDALRSAASAKAPPGLLRGMADPLLAPTLRRIHADPGRSMTVEALAITSPWSNGQMGKWKIRSSGGAHRRKKLGPGQLVPVISPAIFDSDR